MPEIKPKEVEVKKVVMIEPKVEKEEEEEEPSIETTKKIIKKLKPTYEKYHNVIISDQILEKLITLSDKYIYNRYRPDKQIDILDEVCSKVNIKKNIENINYEKSLNNIKEKKFSYIKKKNIKKAYEFNIKENNLIKKKNLKKKIVTEKDLAYTINQKTSVPIYELLNNQKEIINNIDNNLKNTIIGQENAIKNQIKCLVVKCKELLLLEL